MDRLRPPRAGFHRGIVGDDHHRTPRDLANAGNDADSRSLPIVLVIGDQQADFEEEAAGIDEFGHAFPRGQLASLMLFFDPRRTTPRTQPVLQFTERGDQLAHVLGRSFRHHCILISMFTRGRNKERNREVSPCAGQLRRIARAPMPAILGSLFLLGFMTTPAAAHVVSVSTGELTIEGLKGTYELRMPAYEVAHLTDPVNTLLDQIHFSGAERVSGECEPENTETYLCRAEYAFQEPVPDALEATSTLYEVTVPNHVHLLYAVQGENSDQVVLDQESPTVEIRFHPPSLLESLQRDSAAGIGRLLGSVSGLLFLGVLALAGRTYKEVGILGALFLAAQWIALPIAARIPMNFSDTFLESAMALTVAYLAAEVLLLPDAASRWMVVPFLGIVHGFAYAAFPTGYLAGATLAQAALLALATFIVMGLRQSMRRGMAMALLGAGVAWFVVLLAL